MKDAEDRILINPEDIVWRWREYAENLYHDENNLAHDDNDQSSLLPILESEVDEGIQKLAQNKATEVDDLPAESLKTESQQMTKIVCQLCRKILESDEWSTGWLRTINIPILKMAGTTECTEHHSIALISHSSEVLSCILLSRMTMTAEEQVAEEHMGFRKKVKNEDQTVNI